MSEFLWSRLTDYGDRLAIAEGSHEHSYRELSERIERWSGVLAEHGVAEGQTVSLEGDYGLESIGLLLALLRERCIIVPLSSDTAQLHDEFREVAMAQWRIDLRNGMPSVTATGTRAEHPLYEQLRYTRSPGVVLFTSGSTGKSKAAVHDLAALLEKYERPRSAFRTIVFLQLDHIGGLNTLLYTLANGGAVIVPRSRAPGVVCETIERHRAQLLPASPTFLNLVLLTEAYRQYDCSSLQRITYGTETMPESTLERVCAAFPGVTLQQTYGMTELGILRSKSREDGSLWVKVGGEGFEIKIVDDRLFVRARSAMLGYLNAPSPFDAEGFMDTGDAVAQDGPWLRILGRTSELINVGGHKVYPVEVENLLLQMEGVQDVAVKGEPHPLTGKIVSAVLRLSDPEELGQFKLRMRRFLKDRLPTYAIPAKLSLTDRPLHNARFKRVRN
jgi:acyl-CoA synthetase (AMP-forming)/AMP-acid ligase II